MSDSISSNEDGIEPAENGGQPSVDSGASADEMPPSETGASPPAETGASAEELDSGCEYSTGSVTGEAVIAGPTFLSRSVTYHEIGESAVLEGDIVLGPVATVKAATEAAKASPADGTAVPFGHGRTGVAWRWPNRIVPWDLDPSLPSPTWNRVFDAVAHWESKTGLSFPFRSPENASLYPNYISFRLGAGCSSAVGMYGGRQFVSLSPGCTTGNAIHEIGHAIGLWHEHSRQDRDSYVKVIWSNIEAGATANFYQNLAQGDDLGSYDYRSIMHYGRNAFARKNPDGTVVGPTIVPTHDPSAHIGQRRGLSDGDIATVRSMYSTTGGPIKISILPSAYGAGTAWLGGFNFAQLEPSFGYAAGRRTGNFVYHFQLPVYTPEQRFAGISAVLASGSPGLQSDVTLIVNGEPQDTYRVEALTSESNGIRYLWVFPEAVLRPGRDNDIAFAVRGDAAMPNGISVFQRTFSSVSGASIEVSLPYVLAVEPSQQPYDAAFLSQEVSTFMIAGSTHPASIKMYNVNERVWRYGKVWLRSEEPANNTTWSVNRVDLPNSADLPGHRDALFNLTVTAPQKLGPTLFRWGMAAEGYGRFGQRNAPVWVMVAKDALFLRQSVPATMVGGTTANASVTFRNIGDVTWTKSTNFKLGSQGPQDNDRWGIRRVELPDNLQVPPGAEHTFEFSIKAPATVGKAVFQWQIVQEGVRWLGSTSDPFEIRVMPVLTTEANKGPQIVHTPIHPGSIQMVAVTMKNVGTDTWTAAGQYMLGSWEPADNVRWGTNRVPLPHDVPPNTEVTFTFGIPARDASGTWNFQWRMIKGTEWFGQANDPIAVTVAPMQTPSLNLYFVKTRNVGQGKVEAFRMAKALGYSLDTALATRFSVVDTDNGWFGMHRNGNLYFVKARNTASGRAEVFTATHASDYQDGISAASRFAVDTAGDGKFGVIPNGDLYFIKTRNTGTGTIEVHTALSPTFAHGLSIGTRFSVAEAPNGWFGLLPNNDLYFIKTRNTPAGKVEAFSATSGSWYQTGIAAPTRFTVAEAENGVFGMLSNGDVYFVKTRNTASGMVEVATATRASNYASGNLLSKCHFATAEGPNGTWGMV